jgi:ribosomal protein S19E (S16A)
MIPIIAAAIARKLYFREGMGVGLFRTKFGGSVKRKMVTPEYFAKASGESCLLGLAPPCLTVGATVICVPA